MRLRQSLLLLAVPFLTIGCTSSSGDPSSAPSSAAKAECHKDSPLSSVDQGWSLTTPDAAKRETVSFAAIIKNTSKSHEVTRSGTIHVEFLDDSGEQIRGDEDSEPETSQSFDVRGLAPGTRTAVTGTAMLSEAPDKVKVTTAGACTRETDTKKTIKVRQAKFSPKGETLTVDLSGVHFGWRARRGRDPGVSGR